MKFHLIFLIHIILSLIISTNSYIVIPFNNINSEDYADLKDAEELIKKLSYLDLYSDFYLGSSPYKLPVCFTQDIDYFVLAENTKKELISLQNYQPSSSESFKIIDRDIKISLYKSKEEYFLATEDIHFLQNDGDISMIYSDKETGKIDANKYSHYSNVNFFYPDIKASNFGGYLGLSYNKDNNNNFLLELKSKSIINSTIWSIDFPDIDEDTYSKGNIVIGEYPHIYDKQYYKEDQYFKYDLSNEDNNKEWQIKLDSASILKSGDTGTSCFYLKRLSINFGLHLMYAPKGLFEQLKDLYFDPLFDKNVCDYKKIKIDKEKIIFIFCDKKSFDIDEQRKFPKIIFNVQKLGGDLELNYKDVFITNENNVYFMIAFNSKENDDTISLGQIFLYKYKFTFDLEKKEIGFYRNDLKNEKIAHRIKRAFRGKIFLFIIILILIIGILFFLYKKGYLGKKKLINFNKNISHFNGENNIDQGYELKNDN